MLLSSVNFISYFYYLASKMKRNIYNAQNIARYFAGELDKENQEIMDNEIGKDKNKKREMRDFSIVWEESEKLDVTDKIDVDGDWQKVRSRIGFHNRQKRIPVTGYFIRIAAILVVAVGLTVSYNLFFKKSLFESTQEYKVLADNEIKKVQLPDGSVVTLNKGSNLIYNANFNISNREVILEGEGYFEVEKNKSIPFKVYVSKSTIEVLGTRFNVKPSLKDITVSVDEGHVAFYETEMKNNKIELVENEQSSFNSERLTFESKIPVNHNIMAWRTNKLSFNGESLEIVFHTIADIFNKKLTLQVEFTETINPVVFQDQSITDIMNSIQLAVGKKFDYVINDEELIISEKEEYW